ncbi:hypothetical protein CVT24_000275 [Panaeolus cyanescens]|uniref:Velvet domain-containing protein n=1 Tax=Panaeolus cyanescens TaxID=181874 RepID=A0A409YDB3_9AGAR|nr:hypothetical protein CVT24_000275 [Panaeolus cyanescens]
MDLTFGPYHRQNAGQDDHASFSPRAPTIGEPVTFATGQFAKRTVRFALEELQKADSGRKYAKVDRRPLDPPPTVLLRLFEVHEEDGDVWETEMDYKTVQNIGFMCSVDLFPVPESAYEAQSSSSRTPPPSSSSYQHDRPAQTDSSSSSSALTYFPLHPYTSVDINGQHAQVSPFQIPRRQLMLGHLHPSSMPSDVVHQRGTHLVTESSKLTPALVGEKFVEPTLVEFEGKSLLVFVFGDLAVQREGVFILRYRTFDLFSTIMDVVHPPALAELYGGSFKVYSTREFPGLEPSTALTKALALCGVRVTLRDAERKSKKRTPKTPKQSR